jgi:hypothetical protein
VFARSVARFCFIARKIARVVFLFSISAGAQHAHLIKSQDTVVVAAAAAASWSNKKNKVVH